MTDEQLSALIDRRINDRAMLIDERSRSENVARMLQATEYERRLDELNGEHKTMERMRETYVLREVYTKDLERMYTERNESRKVSEEQREAAELSKTTATRNAMIAAMGMLVALVGWAMTLLLHFIPGGRQQ
jgi:hypothetical protein